MTDPVQATQLSVVTSEDQRFRHHPAYSEIVKRAHAQGLAGATVHRGMEGFGATGRLHAEGLVALGEKLPVTVVVVDTDERVRDFLATLDDVLAKGGMAVLTTVEWVDYSSSRRAPRHRD